MPRLGGEQRPEHERMAARLRVEELEPATLVGDDAGAVTTQSDAALELALERRDVGLGDLEQRGALKARRKVVNGRSRVYYSVTAKGRKRLQHLMDEWRRVSGGVRSVLGEPGRA